MYCVLCTVYCVLYTVYYVLCFIYCARTYCEFFFMYYVLYILCVPCIVYCLLCSVYCVLCFICCARAYCEFCACVSNVLFTVCFPRKSNVTGNLLVEVVFHVIQSFKLLTPWSAQFICCKDETTNLLFNPRFLDGEMKNISRERKVKGNERKIKGNERNVKERKEKEPF